MRVESPHYCVYVCIRTLRGEVWCVDRAPEVLTPTGACVFAYSRIYTHTHTHKAGYVCPDVNSLCVCVCVCVHAEKALCV